MRKNVLILGLLMMIVLVVGACAQRQTAQQPARSTVTKQNAGQPDYTPSTAPSAQQAGNATVQTPAQPPTTQTEPEQQVTSSVTQDDLNKLKAGVEGLQPEDLGGLK